MDRLEQQFLEEVTQKAGEAKLVCGWDPAHFLSFLEKRGPVCCVTEQARRGAVSDGFLLSGGQGSVGSVHGSRGSTAKVCGSV